MKMMRRFWDADTIAWMKDASEHSDYNRKLAQMIIPHLAPGAHVCDAGCGLGYLALELAGHAGRVTAVDVSAEALNVLEGNARKRGAVNIVCRCGDVEALLPDTPYDAMVFCFFGGGDDALRIARTQCRGEVFLVLRNYAAHRFSVRQHRMEYTVYRDVCALLDQLGVPYTGTEHSLDLGQPFRSMEDVRRFFVRYSRDDESEITDTFLLSRVQATGRSDFPYYMPHLREVGFIRLRAEDIPDIQMGGGA